MKTKEYIEAEKKVNEVLPNWVELKELLEQLGPLVNNRYLTWCRIQDLCIAKVIPKETKNLVD
jgi:hypothetical protein